MSYSWATDPGFNIANSQIDAGWAEQERRDRINWENQQRMTDPAYWAKAFGMSGGAGGASATANPYQQRLNALLDNPDSIANTGVYKFAFEQGNEAVNRNLAAKGMLKSGNRLAELTKFGQGLASQQYGAEADRLAKLYGIGEQANVEREKANQQMRLSMMNNMMDMNKRYMAPGIHQVPGAIVARWD